GGRTWTRSRTSRPRSASCAWPPAQRERGWTTRGGTSDNTRRMTADTFQRVSRIISKYLDLPVEKIEEDSRLEDLGVDSLGALELIFEFEEEFKIAVPNERAADFTTVRAVCDG